MSDESAAPELEAKAREMGWVPREEFKGAEDKWIPADEFVDRGEHLLPILHATNKRLKGDVESLRGQVNEMTTALREARETMAALETYHDEDVKRKVEQARKNLKDELANASREGNHEAIAELTTQLTELNAEEKADAKRREEEEAARTANARRPQDYTKDPNFISWKADNPWYGEDMVRTSIANTMSWKLRDPNYAGHVPNNIVGRAYLDQVSSAVEKEIAKLTGGRTAPNSKVEGGGARDGGGGGGTKGKSYADLPADAKAACDSFEKELVGPSKTYKTRDEWRKKYAARHFS